MRLPRCSIADLMALAGLASLDCLAWQVERLPMFAEVRSFVLPTLNVLVVATYGLVRSARRDAPRRFLAGFVVAGWAFLLRSIYLNRGPIRAALTPAGPDTYFFPVAPGPSEWELAAFGLHPLLPARLAGLIYSAIGDWRERRRNPRRIVRTKDA